MFGIFRRIRLQGFAVFFAIYLLGLIAILIYGYIFTDNRLALFLLLFVWIMLYLCVLMAQITFGTRIKEFIMNIGVYERIRERRRLAAAAAVADQFEGQNKTCSKPKRRAKYPRRSIAAETIPASAIALMKRTTCIGSIRRRWCRAGTVSNAPTACATKTDPSG